VANPFLYQRPLPPDQLIDREAELSRLTAWCEEGLLVRLDAPRRYGKTTLVRRLYAGTERRGTIGVLCDLKGVLTLADVTTRLGRAYRDLRGEVRKFLDPVLSAIEVSFGLQFGPVGAGARLAHRPVNEEAALLALLDLPARFAEKGWRDVIVCFDEFQDVLAVKAADDKLRSVIQHQERVAYIFAGSEPRLMNTLFADKRRAFWSQAQPLELAPLQPGDVGEYVAARFAAGGREVGEALGPLLGTSAGHPQRTMFLAAQLWALTPDGGAATLGTWEQALVQAKLQEERALDAEWRALSSGQQRVLRAVSLNDGRPYQKRAFEAVGMSQGSLSRVVAELVGAYQLRELDRGLFAFVDPLFELYVADLAADTLPHPGDPD
jgi:uncharacterized protein